MKLQNRHFTTVLIQKYHNTVLKQKSHNLVKKYFIFIKIGKSMFCYSLCNIMFIVFTCGVDTSYKKRFYVMRMHIIAHPPPKFSRSKFLPPIFSDKKFYPTLGRCGRRNNNQDWRDDTETWRRTLQQWRSQVGFSGVHIV